MAFWSKPKPQPEPAPKPRTPVEEAYDRAAQFPEYDALRDLITDAYCQKIWDLPYEQRPLDIPAPFLLGVMNVLIKLYAFQGLRWLSMPDREHYWRPPGLTPVIPTTPISEERYNIDVRFFNDYVVPNYLAKTNDPAEITRLLVDIFSDAMIAFCCALPHYLSTGTEEPSPTTLVFAINTVDHIIPALAAFLKAFDRPDIKRRGILRLRSTEQTSVWKEGDIEVCDFFAHRENLMPEHAQLFSYLPGEVKIPFDFFNFNTRFEHTHIIGGTGHGKTQLLQKFICSDLVSLQEGKGSVVVIDSQGDLIRTISHLAVFDPAAENSLADKLVLIDPNDVAYPPALNLFDLEMGDLERYDAADREKLLNGTVALYEYIFGALLGAELTNKQGVIFRYLARLMMVIPNATIHTLIEIMEDAEPFRGYMAELEGSARRFFETQFFDPTFNDTKRQVLNRLWGVLSNPTLDRMFGHPRNKVDLYDAMNTGKIVLINTAKDLLKTEGCQLFGRFFISLIAQAALQRAAIPEDRRRSTFVYVDEAHEYFDDTLDELLNQARKFKVGLVLAHQNLEQLSESLRATIMASTSIKIAGGVSARDANALAKEMRCEPEFILNMQKHGAHTEFACWIKNITNTPLKAELPLGAVNQLPALDSETYARVIAATRARYCAPAPGEREPEQSALMAPPTLNKKAGFELGSPELL